MRALILPYLCFFSCFVLLAVLPSALAQGLGIEEEQEGQGAGEGPRGRFTQQQAESIAQRRIRGEILATESYRKNDRLYHEVTIKAEDQSVYEVEINALTGEVYRIEIEYLAPDAILPMAVIGEDAAGVNARIHIAEKTRGRGQSKILDVVFAVFKKKPVYHVAVKKSARRYNVVIDARDGNIIKVDRLD